MTYCLGWKLKSGILLAADSAVTWLHEPPSRAYPLDVTSVGERHGVIETRKGPKYVFEEALKIRQIGDSIAAITGDMGTAANLLRTIETAHAAGLSYRAALDTALTSNRPFSEALGVSVLYAFYEAGVPHLMQLDTDDGGRIHEIEDLAQIGSIPEAHKRYTRQIIASLREVYGDRYLTKETIANVFSQVIALMQSYGVHDYLIAHGVGGAVVGAWVTPEGAAWQRDVFYIIHPPEPSPDNLTSCAVIVRDGTVCLLNNSTDFCVALTNRHHDENSAASETRADDALTTACDRFDRGLFDHLVFINQGKHIASVVHMDQHRHHYLLYVDSYEDEEGDRRIGIVWTPTLLQLVNTIPGNQKIVGDELTLQWIPYRPASPEQIALIENAVGALRPT
jgi:hypothetical protein